MQPEWFQRTPEVGISRQRQPGEEVWRLRSPDGTRIQSCFQAEDGVEIQFLHQGVMAYAHRCMFRAQALEEAEENRQRLMREGWTALPEGVA